MRKAAAPLLAALVGYDLTTLELTSAYGLAPQAMPGLVAVGLAVLALPLLVLALDVSVLYLAAPALAADLEPSATQQLWILDVYGFLIAGFLITMGALGDRIGRRRLLLTGAVVFAAAALVVVLVGVTRVYLGAHYPSDVVGGAAIGAAWAFLLAGLIGYPPARDGPPR